MRWIEKANKGQYQAARNIAPWPTTASLTTHDDPTYNTSHELKNELCSLNNTNIILVQVVWLYLDWRVSCDFYTSRDGWSTSTMQSEWPCPQPCLTSTCWKHFKQRYVNITILKHISHAPFSYRLISTWTHTYIHTHKTKYIHLHDIYSSHSPWWWQGPRSPRISSRCS